MSECRQYFRQLGISEHSSQTVEVLTDSEPLIGALLRRLSLPLQVKAAAPQSHESIGLAERNVRRVKEMTACIRSDLRLHGFDLTGSPESFNRITQYVTQTQNHFGVGGSIGQSAGLESKRSPIELIVGKDRPKPTSTMFGSVCHARVPDSLIESIPERTRFIPAAYLHVKPNSLAHAISSRINGTPTSLHPFSKALRKMMDHQCPSSPDRRSRSMTRLGLRMHCPITGHQGNG